jgi:AraC-like DNA-binding protein
MAAGLLLALCIVLGQDKAYLVIRIAARLCFAVQVLFVWISGSIMLRDFRSQLDNIYSDDRSWELRPVTIMLNLLGVISVIAILLNLVGKEWFAGKWIVAAPALMMSVLLYALGYVMSEIRVVIEDIQEQDIDEPLAPGGYDDAKSLAGDGTEADYVVALKNRLETYMDSNKPYSDPAFTIYDLARALGSNRSYISNFINHNYGMNFAMFVAHYRLKNAKTILADRAFGTYKEALNAAMKDSGFNSEPTFYRLFKQQTGTTPREYRNKSIAFTAD